jgi:hypothetical protein
MITNCGILSFYHEIHSDHRGMYIDFDTKALFNGKPPELHNTMSRILTSKFSRAVLKYKNELWKQLEAHYIPNRSIAIKERAKTENDESFKKELNAIAK